MKDKAYIVANEQQEMAVLEKLEREAVTWRYSLKPASQFIPSKYSSFPYGLKILDSYVVFASLDGLEGYEIVFDGRKENEMSDKYVVSQEFMNELEEWKKRGNTDVYFVGSYDISMLPIDVIRWWDYPEINNFEQNNRLIAIIRWVNGEDVFEVEKPKKWVVRSKEKDSVGDYWYIQLTQDKKFSDGVCDLFGATKFDTKEEAESWANAHQEVIEVEE